MTSPSALCSTIGMLVKIASFNDCLNVLEISQTFLKLVVDISIVEFCQTS